MKRFRTISTIFIFVIAVIFGCNVFYPVSLYGSIRETVEKDVMRVLAGWGNDNLSNSNSLHGYIHKLRRTLRQDPAVAIINQRGFGYMLTIKSELSA